MSYSARGIHHINFLVRDLDAAELRYRQLLGLGPALREALPGRGVMTARFRLGATWLVLVQPIGDEGEPARLLRERGEGFMLLSLEGWRIADLGDCPGATLQLTETPAEN